ncbi:MAG: hypothetical protein Q8927_19030 [Bacteroidota bacterium]|nr:hypothetical protein [Bacteroidota bacterium]MDP4248156.1 hypothetical protein [Bacteroidota bacterium]MDP4256302.1 hypothetical protein [Bacteroidota bacterium]MDP4260326.1 hypothetical protein [Bacteroidota bacterium]
MGIPKKNLRNQTVAHIFATEWLRNKSAGGTTLNGVEMVEVFKTNVHRREQSKMLLSVLSKAFPSVKINFDLSDCDKVLRVEGADLEATGIMILIKEYGFDCEILD